MLSWRGIQKEVRWESSIKKLLMNRNRERFGWFVAVSRAFLEVMDKTK